MAFSRAAALNDRPDEATLTRDMAGVGMNFAADASPSAPIEETLVHASAVGMDGHDLRVLAVLTTWVGVHHRHVNADRLVRCVAECSSNRVRAYWAAVARWLSKDRRFTRLAKLHAGPPIDLLPFGTDFQIARRGEDERFAGSSLRVPAGTLRDRTADVLSPEALVRRHAGYRMIDFRDDTLALVPPEHPTMPRYPRVIVRTVSCLIRRTLVCSSGDATWAGLPFNHTSTPG